MNVLDLVVVGLILVVIFVVVRYVAGLVVTALAPANPQPIVNVVLAVVAVLLLLLFLSYTGLFGREYHPLLFRR